MVAFVLAATLVVIPMFAPYNQILLLPAIFAVLRDWPFASARQGLVRIAGGAAGLSIAWPWIAALALVVASPLLPAQILQRAWQLPLWTTFATPALCLVLLALWILDAYTRLPAAARPTPPALALNGRSR